MSQSVWAYFVVLMGIVSLVTVNYIGNFANNNELDYYALKEIQQSAMMDSIDFIHYREEGEFRISPETFIEQFTKRFANVAGANRKYQITFKQVIANPPMTSVLIESTPNTTLASQQTIDDLIINNEMHGILLLDKPVVNVTKSNLEPPSLSIKTVYKPCPYVNGKMDTNVAAAATVYVKGIETDDRLGELTSKVNIKNTGSLFASRSGDGYLEQVYQLGIRKVNGQEVDSTYLISGTIKDASGRIKEGTESVILNAGDKCMPVVERPTVYLDPPSECGVGAINVNINTISSQMTDIYYQIDNGAVTKISNQKTAKVTISNIGEHTLKAWATPAGAGQDSSGAYLHMSPEKFGRYTVLDANNKINLNYTSSVPKNTWTQDNITIKLNPTFTRGEVNEKNTSWNWWTDIMPTATGSWEGLTWYSVNRGEQTKVLSAEGRRRFRVTVDIPASDIGLGCNNVRLSSDLEEVFLIDRTNPNSCYVTSNGPASGRWTNRDVTLTGHGTDSNSGIKSISLQFTGATTDRTQPNSGIIQAEGTSQVTPICTDNAGNKRTGATYIVKIDKTPPVINSISCTNTAACSVNSGRQNIIGSWRVSDSVSEIQSGQANFSEQEFANQWDNSFKLSGSMTKAIGFHEPDKGISELYAFKVSAMDNAGNEASRIVNCPARIKNYTTVYTYKCSCTCDLHHGDQLSCIDCNNAKTKSECEAFTGMATGKVTGLWIRDTSVPPARVPTSCTWTK